VHHLLPPLLAYTIACRAALIVTNKYAIDFGLLVLHGRSGPQSGVWNSNSGRNPGRAATTRLLSVRDANSWRADNLKRSLSTLEASDGGRIGMGIGDEIGVHGVGYMCECMAGDTDPRSRLYDLWRTWAIAAGSQSRTLIDSSL